MLNRLNPLDGGLRPAEIDDGHWSAQVTARRRDLVGALAETVLDRRLTPVEHAAVDIALGDSVRSADVPVVVDRLLAPEKLEIRTVVSPRTADWLGMPSAGWWLVIWLGSSTGLARFVSIRVCR